MPQGAGAETSQCSTIPVGGTSSPSLSLPFYKGDMAATPWREWVQAPASGLHTAVPPNASPSVSAHPHAPPSQYKDCVPPGMAFRGIALPLHGSPRPLSACASSYVNLTQAQACEKKEYSRENASTGLGYGQAWWCIFLIRD